MTPRVLLATIPSSGTCFWHSLLLNHGIEVTRVHLSNTLFPDILLMLQRDPEYTLVTTYRDLDKIKHTWQVIGNSGYNYTECLENWYRLLTYNPIVVSVDTNREASLSVLRDALGIQFKTDWEPVNARSSYKLSKQKG